MTDGEENLSKETTKEEVKDIISGHEAKGDWTFIYIGENPERWSIETGMSYLNAMKFDFEDMDYNFEIINDLVSKCRNTINDNQNIQDNPDKTGSVNKLHDHKKRKICSIS